MPEQLWWMRPRRPRQGGGRHRVARRDRAAGQVRDAQAARGEDLGHPGDVLGRAAVRRARHREVAIVEPEALEHAGAHGGQRLQRLGRRAQEGLLVVVAVGQAPHEAVLALDATAALDDDPAAAQATTVERPGPDAEDGLGGVADVVAVDLQRHGAPVGRDDAHLVGGGEGADALVVGQAQAIGEQAGGDGGDVDGRRALEHHAAVLAVVEREPFGEVDRAIGRSRCRGRRSARAAVTPRRTSPPTCASRRGGRTTYSLLNVATAA